MKKAVISSSSPGLLNKSIKTVTLLVISQRRAVPDLRNQAKETIQMVGDGFIDRSPKLIRPFQEYVQWTIMIPLVANDLQLRMSKNKDFCAIFNISFMSPTDSLVHNTDKVKSPEDFKCSNQKCIYKNVRQCENECINV